MGATDIPQYKLQDLKGEVVDFDLLIWDKRDQDYDYEKPHRHNFHEVLVFYKGGGAHDIDFTTYEIKNRSLHFVAPHNVHLVLRNAASSGCSLLFSNDYLPAELISNLPFSRECPILSLSKTDFSIVSGLIDTIKAEHTGKQDNYKSLIKAYMSALMNHLLRIYRIQYPESVRKSNLHPLIDSFHKLIGQHFAEHLTIEYYASQLNISAKHLIEICKEQTGKTALQHIKEHVVSEAKKLLFHSNLSIKEIAYKLGFDEPANFSKYFKSATSYTPVEYREGIR